MSSEGRVDFVFTGGGNKVQVGISTFPGITDMRHSQSGRSYLRKDGSILFFQKHVYRFATRCHSLYFLQHVPSYAPMKAKDREHGFSFAYSQAVS